MSKSKTQAAPKYYYLVNEDGEILADATIEQMYNNMLDDCYEETNICGYKYLPSRALKDVDPIAYNCGYGDFYSSLMEDGYEEISMTVAEAAKRKLV